MRRRQLVSVLAAATLPLSLVTQARVALAVPTITEFPIPTATSASISITAGPDGALWFAEEIGNKIGRITTSGSISEFPLTPGGPHSAGSEPAGIASGPDGALWFTELGTKKIGRMTTSGSLTEFPLSSTLTDPSGITAGPDGALWFTEFNVNQIGRITTSGIITEFPLPAGSTNPQLIVAGPDGALWFTEPSFNLSTSQIGRITTSGSFSEFSLPPGASAVGITAGPDGALWFADNGSNKIGRITTSGTITEFPIPTASSNSGRIATGADGALWFTEGNTNKIGRITTSGSFSEFPIPTSSSRPIDIVLGPDSAMWFTEYFGNKIGRIGTGVLVPAVAVLPAVTNGAYGGYITAATIQNMGIAPAAVRVDYFDQNGAPVGIGDSISSLPVNASWTVRQDNGNSFPSSGGDQAQAGTAVVSSTQPIAAFVNEFPPGSVGDATSYSGVQIASGVGTILYAPTIVNNAYGGYTTGIGLLNEGSGATDVTITYRDGSGAVIKTQAVTALAAHAYHALYSGDTALGLPSGFAGTATITSTAQPLGAIVNETGPGGQFSSYDAVPSGTYLLNAPVALNNAFGGYYTGMGIQNTSAGSGSVRVTYYDAAGTPTIKDFTIPGYGSLGVYQGSATDGPAVGAYTATIFSILPLAAIVNEVAPSNTSAKQSTSYNTFSAGSAALHLPLVENAGSDPWNTGEGIMNTGTASTTVTVNYYDTVTGVAVGAPQTQTLAPHAFWGLYQPSGGLPSGTRATAVITTSSGGQVAVICNESSSTTFMSYDGQ